MRVCKSLTTLFGTRLMGQGHFEGYTGQEARKLIFLLKNCAQC